MPTRTAGEKEKQMRKCPSCSVPINYVNLKEIDIHVGGKSRWVGSSYVCPLCGAILSVSIDLIALKTDIIEAVEKLLKQRFGH